VRYFWVLLLAISAIFRSEALLASTQSDDEIARYFEYYWDGDDKELNFNINISNELQFHDTYKILTKEDAQGCEIVCQPIQGQPVFSEEGYELQKIQLLVGVINTTIPNTVRYVIQLKSFYEGTNDKGECVAQINQFEREGEIENLPIDLNQHPEFFTYTNHENEGVITFKSALVVQE
jgi:hypothetical protein